MSKSGDAVLRVSDVSVEFGGVRALSDVSLAVRRGAIHAVIGPNGAGKTTLFNSISRLVPITSGEIVFDGCNIAVLPAHRIAASGIARTFQNLAVFGDMTVEDSLLLGCHVITRSGWFESGFRLPRARRERSESARIVCEVADRFGLASVLERPASSLAYGDRKRLEIARALCSKPRLLMLDEPAAGMNPSETAELTELIRSVRDEFDLSIVLVEHDMRLVMEIADLITVLDFGEVIADGSPGEVSSNQKVIEAYLGDTAG